jgi:hypothetical protein
MAPELLETKIKISVPEYLLVLSKISLIFGKIKENYYFCIVYIYISLFCFYPLQSGFWLNLFPER